jgi:hypothetical protein
LARFLRYAPITRHAQQFSPPPLPSLLITPADGPVPNRLEADADYQR